MKNTFLAFMLALVFNVTIAADIPSSPSEILEVCLENHNKIQNMHAQYVSELIDSTFPSHVKGSPTSYLSEERLQKGKYFFSKYYQSKASEMSDVDYIESSFDGDLSMQYAETNKSAEILKGLTGRPVEQSNELLNHSIMNLVDPGDFRDEFPNGIPRLVKVIKNGIRNNTCKLEDDIIDVSGKKCVKLTISANSNDGANYSIYLAYGNSMFPMKFTKTNGANGDEYYTVQELGLVDKNGEKYWYPLKATRKADHGGGFGLSYKLTVNSFEPNVANLSKESFRLKLPRGTDVIDYNSEISYVLDVPEKINLDVSKNMNNAKATALTPSGNARCSTEKRLSNDTSLPLVTKNDSPITDSSTIENSKNKILYLAIAFVVTAIALSFVGFARKHNGN